MQVIIGAIYNVRSIRPEAKAMKNPRFIVKVLEKSDEWSDEYLVEILEYNLPESSFGNNPKPGNTMEVQTDRLMPVESKENAKFVLTKFEEEE